MSPWQKARNVLCIRLDGMGDLLMTTPAIRALKNSCPGRKITLLTSKAGSEAAAYVPEIDRCWTYAAPWMKAEGCSSAARDRKLIERLHAGRFDAAVIFTVYTQSPLPAALACRLAGIPRILAHCRENPYRLLTTWVREKEPGSLLRHEVRRQLELVRVIGAETDDERLSLVIPDAAVRRFEELLAERGFPRRRPWIVLHPGASAASRRYPALSYVQAARQLSKTGVGIVLTGSTEETGLVDEIISRIGLPAAPLASLAGRLRFVELAAAIRSADAVVTNNTGPAHIAAAVETPVVVLYALTNPQHTPWKTRSRVLYHDVPCKFCYKSVCPEGHQRCLRLVPPAAVVRSVEELLGSSRAPAPVPLEEGLAA